MRISTIGYSIKQGIKNIWRNKMFSIASVATMGACIFLFGLFFSLVMNFNYIIKSVEEGVSMTVFFTEGTDQATIDEIGDQIEAREDVKEVKYVSADEAWKRYQERYFKNNPDLAEGFKKDNPLANSASYEVYVKKVEDQSGLKTFITSLPGVREVNQSEEAVKTLSTVNRLVGYVSIVIIGILLGVSIFLISNTVSVGISVRKEEIGIMKLIGATNLFVRLPFLMEGILIGVVGAAIPLGALYLIYNKAIKYVLDKFHMLADFMNGLLPVNQVFQTLLPVGLILGMGIGLVGSLFTIRKHLKV
ncbi:MAG TPA: ABC transporter permease [Candidatus Pelethocola excrementipullorum]|nr:ABC transporter permease [Candidatus Pelethocola excrementipullorum]